MINKLHIVEDGDCVGLSVADNNDILDTFIDIYWDDAVFPSLFQNKEDAITFLEIIMKLLKEVKE